MTGRLDKASERNRACSDERAGRRAGARAILPTTGARSIGGPLSKIGLAVGYLGLVVMLSVAPFWHQTIAPSNAELLVCTDFGGSR